MVLLVEAEVMVGEAKGSRSGGEHEKDVTLYRMDLCPPHFLLVSNR